MKGTPTCLNVKKFCKSHLLIFHTYGYDVWSNHINSKICKVHLHKTQCLREMGKYVSKPKYVKNNNINTDESSSIIIETII
jgi:hypothetical protein